jgi:hypothetical protein
MFLDGYIFHRINAQNFSNDFRDGRNRESKAFGERASDIPPPRASDIRASDTGPLAREFLFVFKKTINSFCYELLEKLVKMLPINFEHTH